MVCSSSLCRVSDLSIPQVLVDISIPSTTNAPQYSGMGFVLPLDVPSLGRADITLPDLVPLSLDADLQNTSNAGLNCDYSSVSAAGKNSVKVEVTHRWPVDGLERTVFTANSLPATLTGVPSGSGYTYEAYFSLSGDLSDQDPKCNLPPVLVRDVGVSASQSLLTLAWPTPKSIALDVQIQASAFATGSDLYHWQLDIVDPIQGRVLAVPVTLGANTVDAKDPGLVDYKATVNYNPILSADSSPPVGTELIRLQPPTGVAQPTYYVSMSGLTLFAGSNEAPLPINAVPAAVTIQGRVETADQAQPLAAPITFLSTGFSVGNSGIWADYTASTQSGADGQFNITLPAGQYRVLVVPSGDGKHAVLDTQWTIQSSPSNQAGRLLQVPIYSQVQGNAADSSQLTAFQSATIEATPANGLLCDRATQIVALRNSSPGARSASALFQPQSNSQFVLPVDMGRFDFSLRPSTDRPWIVWKGKEVVTGTNTLSAWASPLPVPWAGSLKVPSNVTSGGSGSTQIPWAVMRVYALLDDGGQVANDPKIAATIVQVAESRSEADGTFQLELPDGFQP